MQETVAEGVEVIMTLVEIVTLAEIVTLVENATTAEIEIVEEVFMIAMSNVSIVTSMAIGLEIVQGPLIEESVISAVVLDIELVIALMLDVVEVVLHLAEDAEAEVRLLMDEKEVHLLMGEGEVEAQEDDLAAVLPPIEDVVAQVFLTPLHPTVPGKVRQKKGVRLQFDPVIKEVEVRQKARVLQNVRGPILLRILKILLALLSLKIRLVHLLKHEVIKFKIFFSLFF